MVNEIANPIFFEMETCKVQIIGSGRKRTVMIVIVLVKPDVK